MAASLISRPLPLQQQGQRLEWEAAELLQTRILTDADVNLSAARV